MMMNPRRSISTTRHQQHFHLRNTALLLVAIVLVRSFLLQDWISSFNNSNQQLTVFLIASNDDKTRAMDNDDDDDVSPTTSSSWTGQTPRILQQYSQLSQTEEETDKDEEMSTPTPTADPIPRLEFVHITKTGGSAIEKAAATQARIAWGACHYKNGAFEETGCPHPPDLEGKITHKQPHPFRRHQSYWHTPLQYLQPYPFPQASTKTFVVVRHPYDRAVSLYYCPWNGYKGNNNTINDPEKFNEWIRNHARRQDNILMLRQSMYVYQYGDIPQNNHHNVTKSSTTTTQIKMVDHVIKYEDFPTSFDTLMADYQLNITLPTHKVNPGIQQNHHHLRLSPLNFTSKTLQVLNDIFHDDFVNFGYDMTSPSPDSSLKSI
jgi:hypothetical protein